MKPVRNLQVGIWVVIIWKFSKFPKDVKMTLLGSYLKKSRVFHFHLEDADNLTNVIA